MSGDDIIEQAANAAQTAVTADALAGPDAGRRNDHNEHNDHCANCGAALEGPYCFVCGQHDNDLKRPFWALFSEIIEGLFSLDGRLWHTIPPLFWRPGQVTSRYLAGERARFMAPFRLYLISSVLFFVALALSGGFGFDANDQMETQEARQSLEKASAELREAREAAVESGDSEEAAGLAVAERVLNSTRDAVAGAEEAGQDAKADAQGAIKDATREMTRQSWKLEVRAALTPEDLSAEERQIAEDNDSNLNIGLSDSMSLSQRRWLADHIDRIIDDPGRLLDSMERWAPRLLFVLLPVYALILAGMHFWRRDFVFYDHLVVSLHAHAFFFFLMTALIILDFALGGALASLVFVIWSNFYVYRLHRRVYGHGRVISALRTLLLDLVYFIVLNFALIVLFMLGVAFV